MLTPETQPAHHQISDESLERAVVLIPARNPGRGFISFVESLSHKGFGAIVVVNDGSSCDFDESFEPLTKVPRVHLLQHAFNLGKGRALKTGMNFALSTFPLFDFLITADADGQHALDDIESVTRAALHSQDRVVLGFRDFMKNVPLRSRVGNELTRYIFATVTGAKLRDTQTGLRAFPRSLLPELMGLEGERYEYEMTVLVHLCRAGRKPLELPIETIYIEGNRSSHFDPIRDSMRIYFVLARYFLSSIIAAVIDFLGFALTFAMTGNVLASVVVGRFSSLVNFVLNKNFVFHNRTSVVSALWRYYMLAFGIAALSYGFISMLSRHLHWNVFAAKVVADMLLSLVSFSMQRIFVFRKPEEE